MFFLSLLLRNLISVSPHCHTTSDNRQCSTHQTAFIPQTQGIKHLDTVCHTVTHYLMFHSFAVCSRVFLLSEVERLQESWLLTTFLSGPDKLRIPPWLFYNQCCCGLPADICCMAQFAPACFWPLSSLSCFQSLAWG